MRSTMSLVAVWEAGADSHQPSTARGRADQGRTAGGRADQGRTAGGRAEQRRTAGGRADQGRTAGGRAEQRRTSAVARIRVGPQAVARSSVGPRRSRGSGFWSLGVITRQKADLEVLEASVVDACADVVDQPDDETLVVDGAERRGEHLLGLEEVMEIGPGVVRAGVAIAVLVQ